MTQQFTASEVRTESCKQGQLHRQPASDMLRAFADLLEAREKAVPVAWSLIFEESIGVNAPTTFKRREDAEDYADACAMPDKCNPFPHRPKVVPLYTHPAPSDAERLAEALRAVLEAMYPAGGRDDDGGRPNSATEQIEHAERIALAALTAHSAQAQPPAASVTERDEDTEEHCESGDPSCGPVEFHDSEGVPLCKACWDALVAENRADRENSND